MKNTYWNGNGKYQEFVDKIQIYRPDYGYTENENMNLFNAICNLYYDCYNNGGCNIKDGYIDKVGFIKEKVCKFNLTKFIKEDEYREEIANKVFEYLFDKDMSYDKIIYYFNFSEDGKCYHSKTYKEGWDTISFGLLKEAEDWMTARLKWKESIYID